MRRLNFFKQTGFTPCDVKSRVPVMRSENSINSLLPFWRRFAFSAEQPHHCLAERKQQPQIHSFCRAELLNRVPVHLHSVRIEKNDSTRLLPICGFYDVYETLVGITF